MLYAVAGAICFWVTYILISVISSESKPEYVYERVTCYQYGNIIFDEVLHHPSTNQFVMFDKQENRVSVPYDNASCIHRRIGSQPK